MKKKTIFTLGSYACIISFILIMEFGSPFLKTWTLVPIACVGIVFCSITLAYFFTEK